MPVSSPKMVVKDSLHTALSLVLTVKFPNTVTAVSQVGSYYASHSCSYSWFLQAFSCMV